jgi:hypothetical protein
MVHRVQELALGYPEGRLELQLIGGYSDSRNYSEELFYNIMRKLLLCLMLWGGFPLIINVRKQMVCTFSTLCKYTMRSSRCYWSAVDCYGGATLVEVG